MGHPHNGRGKKQSQPISNLKQPADEESKLSSSLMKPKQNELSNSTIVEEDADATAVMIGDMTDTTTLLSDDDNWTDTSFDFTDNASCSNSDVSCISGSTDKHIVASRVVSDASRNSSSKIMLTWVLKAWEAMPYLSEPSSELSKSIQHHNSNTTIEAVRACFEKCGIQDLSRKSYLPSSSDNDLQTWPALPPIEPSFEFSKSRHQHNSNIEVVSDVLEQSYGLTGGASYIASSSNSDLHEGDMSSKRSWREVLVGPETSSEQTRDTKGKSLLHETDSWVKVVKKGSHTRNNLLHDPDSWVKVVKKGSHTRDIKGNNLSHDPDSWVKVVKKGPHMQKLNDLSKETAKKQHIPGDDYKKYRHNANQHWEIQKSLVEQARKAYASRKWDDGVTLSNQARKWKEKAEQADEKASQDIFDSRNKNNIVDLMTIDLHGQHVKEGMTILKYHLAFGVYGRSLRRLRVITGYGSGGTGQSMLKQAVVDLLKSEKFEWEKENEGSLLIKFDMKKRKLGFVKL